MASERARPRAPPFIEPPGYARHRPEATLLYQIVEQHYPELLAARETAGRPLPKYVQEEFEAYLKWVLSLPFALRFLLATDPAALTQVLGIVYRTISAHVLKRARLTRATGATGAVTLIQRFGSALNLNIHFHMLVLDGAYLVDTEPAVFRRIAPPSLAELQALVERLAERIGRALERRGILARDAESSYLELDPDAGGPMDDLLGRSITYRVAVGPRAGKGYFRYRRCRRERTSRGMARRSTRGSRCARGLA